MAENNIKELDLDALEGVSGGAGNQNNAPEAYCLQCGCQMNWLRNERIGGGNTGIFVCKNVNCTEVGKEKNNLQVRFRLNF